MLPPLDLFTLQVLIIAVTAVMTMAMWTLWRGNGYQLGVAQWWAAVPLAAVSFALAPIGRGLGFSSSLTTLLGYSTGIGLHLIVLIGTMRFASQSVAPRAERAAAGFWLAVTVGMLLLGDERGTRLLVHDVATVCVIVLVPVVLLPRCPERSCGSPGASRSSRSC